MRLVWSNQRSHLFRVGGSQRYSVLLCLPDEWGPIQRLYKEILHKCYVSHIHRSIKAVFESIFEESSRTNTQSVCVYHSVFHKWVQPFYPVDIKYTSRRALQRNTISRFSSPQDYSQQKCCLFHFTLPHLTSIIITLNSLWFPQYIETYSMDGIVVKTKGNTSTTRDNQPNHTPSIVIQTCFLILDLPLQNCSAIHPQTRLCLQSHEDSSVWTLLLPSRSLERKPRPPPLSPPLLLSRYWKPLWDHTIDGVHTSLSFTLEWINSLSTSMWTISKTNWWPE